VDAANVAINRLPVARIAFAKLDWRPEIDGVRAFAVIPVVLFHFELCPGGYAGVDVFFVISGYLVTCILLHELSVGKFSMRHFWLRRTRRLFPAMSVMLIVLLAVSWNVLLAPTYSRLLSQTWAVLLLGANVYFYNENDYFASSLQDPLLHCWSLAVEEQFYVVIPVLLRVLLYLDGQLHATPKKVPPATKLGIELIGSGTPAFEDGTSEAGTHVSSHDDAVGIRIAFTPAPQGLDTNHVPSANEPAPGASTSDLPPLQGRFALAVIIVLLVASLAACIALQSQSKKFAFYLLPLRTWEMLLGSALAFDRRYNYLSFLRCGMAATELSSALGLAMILVSYIISSVSTPWPSYPTLLPTVGTVLFLSSQEPHPKRKQRLAWSGKFLTLSPVAFIGKVSYSLYLWHWPVYLLFAYTTVGSKLDAKATALGIFVSLLAGCGSFFVFESALIRSSSNPLSSNPMCRRILPTRSHLITLSDGLFTAVALMVWIALFIFALVASVRQLGGAHAVSLLK
jgi:peptidoglycan/LPS O-acetylase OafA/YrhL